MVASDITASASNASLVDLANSHDQFDTFSASPLFVRLPGHQDGLHHCVSVLPRQRVFAAKPVPLEVGHSSRDDSFIESKSFSKQGNPIQIVLLY